MAQFFKPKAAKKRPQVLTLGIERLDHQGKGVGFVDGQAVFVEGALPGEQVRAEVVSGNNKVKHARIVKLLKASAGRLEPFCPHYRTCGGCQLQHLAVDEQVEQKQQALNGIFAKMAGVESLPWQAPVLGPEQHYRRVARLACERDNNRWRIGFRQKQQKQVTEIDHCPLLLDELNTLLAALPGLMQKLKQPKSLGHIQLCAGQDRATIVLRMTVDPSQSQRQVMTEFGEKMQCNFLLHLNQGLETVYGSAMMHYEVEGLTLAFTPDNFVQINPAVNNPMIAKAIEWLALEKDDRVVDLFCGMGNFSLPIAKHCRNVIGVEGVKSSIEQAKANAQSCGLENAEFYCADLCDLPDTLAEKCLSANKLLLDPSRPGAKEVLSRLSLKGFERIVYVSCDPVTLARDCRVLLSQGFKLGQIVLLNMFPHTGHIETMALFVR